MALPDPSSRAAIRRAHDLAQIGANRAATAFARLLGRELRALEPRLHSLPGAEAGGETVTGVIFEMEGALDGLIAVLLPRFARERVIETVCSDACASAEMVESALREVCNIIASQAVSAVADHLGARITLSVPILVNEEAPRVLEQLLDERREGRPGIATDSELRESAGEHRAMLVFAPDAPWSGPSDTVAS